MKKLVMVTSILLGVSLLVLGFFGYHYYQANSYPEKDMNGIEEKINRFNLEIEKKIEEKETLEKEKGWKKEVYEEWKKELEASF